MPDKAILRRETRISLALEHLEGTTGGAAAVLRRRLQMMLTAITTTVFQMRGGRLLIIMRIIRGGIRGGVGCIGGMLMMMIYNSGRGGLVVRQLSAKL